MAKWAEGVAGVVRHRLVVRVWCPALSSLFVLVVLANELQVCIQ